MSADTTAGLRECLINSFLTNVPDIVYFKDRDSRIVAASASFARHMGRGDPGEFIGKTDFDLFGEAHAREAFEDEQKIVRTGEPLLGKLEKEVWPGGRATWVMTSKLPLRSPDELIVGTFGISRDVTAAKQTEEDLETARKELMDAARLAGMAEVATGVLHNVGNVLNSLNVSNTVLATGLKEIKAESFLKVVSLIEANASNLADFLTRDPKGRRIAEFLSSFARHLAGECGRLLQEAESQQENIDHIKEIVSMQQSYATMAGAVEPLSPVTLIEDALRMNAAGLVRHGISIAREFVPVPPNVVAERGKVLQILVNLIRNAKAALDERAPSNKILTVRLESGPDRTVCLVYLGPANGGDGRRGREMRLEGPSRVRLAGGQIEHGIYPV